MRATREEAIAWIREEIRSLQAAPKINGGWINPDWEFQMSVWEMALEAMLHER